MSGNGDPIHGWENPNSVHPGASFASTIGGLLIMKRLIVITIFFTSIGVVVPNLLMAQNSHPDTTKKIVVKSVAQVDTLNREMVLGVIEIKGRVEKPGVIIIPRRVEPDIGEIELERSFEKEVKEGVGEIPKPEKEMRRLDRVKSIKKTVERKRK